MDRVHTIAGEALTAFDALPLAAQVAILAVMAVLLGSSILRPVPLVGRALRLGGNLALIVVLGLTALSYVRLEPAFDNVLPTLGFRSQQVVGSETRVPLSSDGHYWVDGRVNGVRQRFMVDTGATVTVLSSEAAEAAGIAPDPATMPLTVHTAGGPILARLGTIDELRAGSIEADGLEAIVTGAESGVNVLGMNFLSRLKSWRVEDGVLVLTPRPAATVDAAATP